MDLPAADERHDLVPHLLEGEALRDELRVVLGHVDRALVPEEVGGVEHRDVEDVALDPLAAVEEPAQLAQAAAHRHAAGGLHRVDRAHLVGDGADAADAGRDVGGLGELPAPEERLEEAGRLVDVEARLDDLVALDLHEEAALPLDPGQRADGDRPRAPLRLRGRLSLGRCRRLPARGLLAQRPSRYFLSWISLSRRKGSAPALKERNARTMPPLSTPRCVHPAARADVFGVSIGPKQP